MKSKLKIYTSFVSPKTIDWFIKENYLPVFVIRFIGNSDLIGQYEGTSIHLTDFSPSSKLYQKWRDNKIDFQEYGECFLGELSKVDLKKTIRRLEIMSDFCEAKGIILMGYGSVYENCHRSILSGFLNESGLLENTIEEFRF